jgi:hypothetical protein
MLRPLLAAAVLFVLALPMTAGGSPIVPQLAAKVTARSITLVSSDGTRVRTLEQNNYRFVVRDRTATQNFHLTGPSLNVRTKVAAKTSVVWNAYLKAGTYVYRSDRNRRLRGSFVVVNSPPPA